MDKIINLGIPHVGELVFESIDTLELIKCTRCFANLERTGWKCLDQKVERQMAEQMV